VKSLSPQARGSSKGSDSGFPNPAPKKGGERSPKQDNLTSVCFLQYESAMERVQKSKLSHYKKTMEVSKEVLCRFFDGNWLQFETGRNLYYMYLYLKGSQECVSA